MASDPRIAQALVVRSAAQMIVRHGIRPNRHWTNSRVAVTISAITGSRVGPRQLARGAELLTEWIESQRAAQSEG